MTQVWRVAATLARWTCQVIRRRGWGGGIIVGGASWWWDGTAKAYFALCDPFVLKCQTQADKISHSVFSKMQSARNYWKILSVLCHIHTFIYLLTYLCPSLPVEHMPSTTPRHRTLFWAALVIPDQLVPCCFSSASVSRLQLLRGRPLFLFPCGFQVKAWRMVLDAGFLRVCPIQPHFLRSICLATGSCPARSHRSSFRIFSCHWIL